MSALGRVCLEGRPSFAVLQRPLPAHSPRAYLRPNDRGAPEADWETCVRCRTLDARIGLQAAKPGPQLLPGLSPRPRAIAHGTPVRAEERYPALNLSSTRLTCDACQRPPLAVWTPARLRCSAI